MDKPCCNIHTHTHTDTHTHTETHRHRHRHTHTHTHTPAQTHTHTDAHTWCNTHRHTKFRRQELRRTCSNTDYRRRGQTPCVSAGRWATSRAMWSAVWRPKPVCESCRVLTTCLIVCFALVGVYSSFAGSLLYS